MSGLSFGLSVAGALFINFSETGLVAALPQIPRDLVQEIIAGTSSDVLGTLPAIDRDAALRVIVGAWQKVYVASHSLYI